MNNKEHHFKNALYFSNDCCYYDGFFNDFMCPQWNMGRKIKVLEFFDCTGYQRRCKE